MRGPYRCYLHFYADALDALLARDEPRLRQVCHRVSLLGGIDSVVAQLALCDAERGRRRRRADVERAVWSNHCPFGTLSPCQQRVLPP